MTTIAIRSCAREVDGLLTPVVGKSRPRMRGSRALKLDAPGLDASSPMELTTTHLRDGRARNARHGGQGPVHDPRGRAPRGGYGRKWPVDLADHVERVVGGMGHIDAGGRAGDDPGLGTGSDWGGVMSTIERAVAGDGVEAAGCAAPRRLAAVGVRGLAPAFLSPSAAMAAS